MASVIKSLSASAGLLAAVVNTAVAAPPIEVGTPFPDITLPALDGGDPVRMSDFRPKPVVLHIFASW